jgi:TonB family protein
MFSRSGLLALCFALLVCRTAAQQDRTPQSSSPPPNENSHLATDDGSSAQPPQAIPPHYRFGKDVTPPQVIDTPDPEYSKEAREACYEGTVVLWLIVDADGSARSVKVQRSLGMGLDENAVRAIKKWTFKPGNVRGQPVAMQINVEVNFSLNERLHPNPESAAQPPRFPGVDTVKYPVNVQIYPSFTLRSGDACVATYNVIITQPGRQEGLTTECKVSSTPVSEVDPGTFPARWKSDQKTLEILGLKGTQPGAWTPMDCSVSRP